MNYQSVRTSPQYYQVHHHLSLTNHPQLQYHPAPSQQQYQNYHDAALAATLGYHCVQSPHQQKGEDRTRCTEHQPAASAFRHPDFRPHRTLPTSAYQRIQHHGLYLPVMASFGDMNEEEVAELQQRSNDFEPQVMGPLVGSRESSATIATEYALADTDPVLQAKTRALPLKFSHYRKIKGDGQCGWRAIAFGYFEALAHLGDVNKFATEEARLRSLVNVVSNAGIDAGLYGDFADEAYELLRNLRQAIHKNDIEPTLMAAFNDETVQNYIITCVKTLTAAWMKTRPEAWSNWLPGQSVDRYCDEQVMPIGSEIDSVSLHALKDVLLEPASIALEVIYLDRSVGTEVNTLHLDSVTSGDFTSGIIRLLYRPGHYDILYKTEAIPASGAVMPTYSQYSSRTHQEPAYDIDVMDFMTGIPGISYAPQHNCWSGSSYSGSDFFSSQGAVQHRVESSASPTTQPQGQSQTTYLREDSTRVSTPPDQLTEELVVRPAHHAVASHASATVQHQLVGGGPFRPSAWELEGDFLSAQSQLPLTTSIFRNSHFNTAHFRNPEFQPEEWRPDDEYIPPRSRNASYKSDE